MSRKKHNGTGSKILKIIFLIPALLSLLGNLFSMIHDELVTMRKRLIILIVLAIFSIVLMSSVWFCMNALIFTYLMNLHLSTATSLVLLLSLNLLILIITCLTIALLKIDPSFPQTRKAVKEVISR